MTTDNPAHRARIKVTDRDRNISYLHYRNGWVCNLDNGISASLTYAGISDKQVMACKFALDQCHHPAQVLAAVKRYAVSTCTYELEVDLSLPDDELPPSGCYWAVDPTGTKMVWVPLPTLHDRLKAVIAEAREAGYGVAYFHPDELKGVDVEDFEQHLVVEGNGFILHTNPNAED